MVPPLHSLPRGTSAPCCLYPACSPQSPAPAPLQDPLHSQVEAEVLLFLEEVVNNELAHKVGVQRVVDDLCAPKLQEKVVTLPLGLPSPSPQIKGARCKLFQPPHRLILPTQLRSCPHSPSWPVPLTAFPLQQ